MQNKDTTWVDTVSGELGHYPVSAERALELAAEARQLTSAVRELAAALQFDDEPSAFTRLLEQRAPNTP